MELSWSSVESATVLLRSFSSNIAWWLGLFQPHLCWEAGLGSGLASPGNAPCKQRDITGKAGPVTGRFSAGTLDNLIMLDLLAQTHSNSNACFRDEYQGTSENGAEDFTRDSVTTLSAFRIEISR